ncbi:hypothetical protein [Amycolatopsis vancoresmycina]|uniref:Alpha/beta hydrolase fold protein n=1 Tax=Amycolatopsis vancoresmycina DSM 44592 TaxID=1292037 RepID=R1GF35_9PSEU|nr:hypothetical protein [Amycolatopsis vancoresmycina]EOD69838.1 alpha/beta hydrolase fold protein [Amycolatopsis vancoresmycina DSM 44592]
MGKQAQAARDGGRTGHEDPHVGFHHDVPRALADEALGRERAHSSPAAMQQPWPPAAWPDVPTRFVLGSEDRSFPPAFLRAPAAGRLGSSRTKSPPGTASRPPSPTTPTRSRATGRTGQARLRA